MKLGLRPVGLGRAFHKLSKYIKFIKFGLADFLEFKFEVGARVEFDLN
jgi:hypothetical protein